MTKFGVDVGSRCAVGISTQHLLTSAFIPVERSIHSYCKETTSISEKLPRFLYKIKNKAMRDDQK